MSMRLNMQPAALLASLIAILLFGELARAGEVSSSGPCGQPYSMFDKGGHECGLDAGAFFSFTANASPNRPAINYQFQTLRFGWMLEDVHRTGFWRGSSEFLVGIFGGPVIQGPGSGLGGAEIIWRYNFVQPSSRFVPYAQIGGGGVYNDIYKDQSQIEVGQAWEFMLHLGLGARFMIGKQWALSAEAGYRHISNAELSSRNAGLNSLGGMLGFSYFFR